MADQTEWFIRKRGKTHGPFTSQQLKQLVRESKIALDTKIRRANDEQWIAASNVKGLFESKVSAELVAAPESPSHSFSEAVSVATGPGSIRRSLPTEHTGIARVPCPFCGEEIAETAIKCRHCNEFLDGRAKESSYGAQPIFAMAPAAQPNVNVVVNQQTNVGRGGARWNPLMAMFLSFLIPGLGQLYKGQPINGFIWFVIVIIGYVALIVPGVILHLCCIVGAGMGDPYR